MRCSGGDSEKKEAELYPEHSFIASCLRIGLSMTDLENLTYIDVMKIFLSFLPKKEVEQTKVATQSDIDRFLM